MAIAWSACGGTIAARQARARPLASRNVTSSSTATTICQGPAVVARNMIELALALQTGPVGIAAIVLDIVGHGRCANHYKSNLRDINFNLFEMLDVGTKILGQGGPRRRQNPPEAPTAVLHETSSVTFATSCQQAGCGRRYIDLKAPERQAETSADEQAGRSRATKR